jgi:uncharacterized membrane protein HdeD (DUF308 family)
MLDLMARSWWVWVVRGICGIVFGAMAIAWPGITLEVLVILYGAYALADGVIALVALVTGRRGAAPVGLLLFEAIVGIGAGIVAFAYPGITLLVLVFLMATWAIMTGVVEIAAAIRLRKEIQGEFWLGLSGVISILFGVIVAAQPITGELFLAYMVGFYAILFGVFFLMLGLRLRKAHAHVSGGAAPAAH